MARITIRHLDDGLKRRLRVRAAEHGRSTEEEVREILRQMVGGPAPPRNLAAALQAFQPRDHGSRWLDASVTRDIVRLQVPLDMHW